jgi:gamma-glutamyltranspeptidase/glutathione hydrolase
LKTRTGEVWTQAPLAKCLEEIGRSNGAAFYSGRIADAIVKAVRSHGGVLDNDDLAAHETEIAAPLVVSWKGLTIAIQPPVSQGVLLAVILRNLARTGEIPAGEIDHICVELTEAAFALRDRSFEGEDLLSEELEFDPSRASNRGGPRSYLHTAGVSAVDGQGQVVTSLASVFDDFGSGVFVPETGFVLNNRGDGFTSTPNEYAPGKRPIHTLAPIMVSGSDFCVGLSTPGADGQVQTLLQVLIRWLFDGDLAAAIDSPRWRSEDQSLLVEEGHPAFSQLVECGHLVSVVRGGDVRFGAITSAGMVRSTPFALSDWRRLTWSGVS